MGSKGRRYRTYVVDGFEILVGRGDGDNDHLTFDLAEPADLWLHVGGGTPGSHVIVRCPDGGDIPDPVIEAAAGVAAWFSKARGAPRVEVHLCRARDVSKPRGAPAGLVQLRRFTRRKVKPGLPAASEGDADT